MTKVKTRDALALRDESGPNRQPFCPSPGTELVAWVVAQMIIGAPVLPLVLCDVPLTQGPTQGLAVVVRERLPKAKADALIHALARPPFTGDLPVYWPDRDLDIDDVLVNRPYRPAGKRKLGLAYWNIEDALLHDLEGLTIADLAGPATSGAERRALARRTKRHVQRGRELLAALGAWPWVHAEGGKLPRCWRERKDFEEPLIAWRRRAYIQAQLRLEAARSGDLGIPRVASFDGATRLFEEGLGSA